MDEHRSKWGRAPPLPSPGLGPRGPAPGLPWALANDYKWQGTSSLIAKGNDAASLRLDSPRRAISSNNKKKMEELGVKTRIDPGSQY